MANETEVERERIKRETTLSGLTENQAKEFNKLFIVSFLIFTAIALAAHIATYVWRPWAKVPPPSQEPPAAAAPMTPGAAAAPNT